MLENKIIDKIKDEKLKPTSFWYFFFRDFSLWGAVILSIIFVSLSLAPIIFILNNLETDYIKHIDQSPLNFYFHIIPYPFIIFALLFTFLAMVAWQKTKNGYKFEGRKILVVSGILSLIFGILLNDFTIGKILDDNFHDPVFNSYKSVQERRMENWNHPEIGRFIGNVSEMGDSSFSLVTDKQNFVINFDEEFDMTANLVLGETVRVVGVYDNEGYIDACIIIPLDKNKEVIIDRTNPDCRTVISIGQVSYLKQKK